VNKRAEQSSPSTPGQKRDKRVAPGGRESKHGNAESTTQAQRASGPDAGDTELVDRARGGDHEAFARLFQRYHRRAYSLAYGVVHNADDALDVVQEAFIKAHRYLDKFEGASSFYTWLYRIVMNLSIDHLRKHKRARHVDFNDALAHGEGDSAVGDDALLPRILGQNPGKSLARKEMREQINEALAGLSDNHRAVLVMREVEGLSYEEMAQVMQCSKGTIMSRLFHARKNMQKRLLEYMGGQKDLEA
jgi:RNA polymerase sigma-70 factor (ECF subfamily)